ncbi:tRNA splicing endonuclease subunit sen2 [Dissophora globulifera]|uniref:tRNA-splicing endonuclease subunit Sen2 n=1 Tax=Dissophora globulifera TaxID=979702 RepID=A0A9P6RT88_9FUNG|nr:tRNA splicing endonuclease subunit sen2 [Dissophora globulifera]
MSLEEITRQRRIDRALLKQEKKLQQQQGVLTPLVSSPTQQSSPTTIGSNQTPSPSASPAITARATPRRIAPEGSTEDREDEEDYEHLQLSMEEAFFLVFAVECIAVTGGAVTTTTSVLEQDRYHCASALSIRDCWLLFSEASTLHEQRLSLQSAPTVRYELEPDNPFITRYVVYHHYRSQGWIVKDGLKYGTDYLLYQKGVVFGHSQYAVKIIHGRNERDPTLSAVHPQLTGSRRSFISPSPGLCLPNAALSWQWLLTLNRVIAQVQKTVILCHVLLPTNISKHQLLDPRTALPLYTVAEIGVKRFIPERNRV